MLADMSSYLRHTTLGYQQAQGAQVKYLVMSGREQNETGVPSFPEGWEPFARRARL